MGGNMVRRLLTGGHQVVGWDRDANVVAELAKEGMTGAESLADLAKKLSGPRAVGPRQRSLRAKRVTASSWRRRRTPL